jgi:hypothetical protein
MRRRCVDNGDEVGLYVKYDAVEDNQALERFITCADTTKPDEVTWTNQQQNGIPVTNQLYLKHCTGCPTDHRWACKNLLHDLDLSITFSSTNATEKLEFFFKGAAQGNGESPDLVVIGTDKGLKIKGPTMYPFMIDGISAAFSPPTNVKAFSAIRFTLLVDAQKKATFSWGSPPASCQTLPAPGIAIKCSYGSGSVLVRGSLA